MNGYYYVVSSFGRVWTGDRWSPEMSQARRFPAGPGDSYAECDAQVAALRQAGIACNVAYAPRRRSQTVGRRSQGATPLSRGGRI